MRLFLLFAAIVGFGVVIFGVGSAVQDPVVARYAVEMPGLERPLRIVQLSDSHASRIDMPPERLRRVVAMMNALHPDMIVLTGDYLSGNPDNWSALEKRAAMSVFAGLKAPLGVFAVLGNHDGSPAQTRAALAGTGVRLLAGERIDVGPVQIVGADDLLRGNASVEGMRRAIRTAPAGKPVLVLAHEPDFFQWLQARRVLMIAGHTHGGQISLPFLGGLSVSPYLDKRLRGLFQENGQVMVVSSGLGTSILPMRIGVPPEIVEIIIR
nr:metallophosphoesterase [Polymorphobacter sp.]